MTSMSYVSENNLAEWNLNNVLDKLLGEAGRPGHVLVSWSSRPFEFET